MRLRDDVTSIREQVMLDPVTVTGICIKNGYRIPKHVLSTDFIVTFADGTETAYSIKADRSEIDKDSRKYRNSPRAYEKAMIRHHIEQLYWRGFGAGFRFVFRNEIDQTLVLNTAQVLMFYDAKNVSCEAHMYMWLVAHKIIRIDLSDHIIRFPELVRGSEDKVRELYERSVSHG